MRAYTYSEARQNFALVLEEAKRDGAVEIRRRDGTVFLLKPVTVSSAQSPLDVAGVKLGVSAKELVSIVREGRRRS